METALREIIDRLLETPSLDRTAVDRVKIEVSRRHGLERIPRNSEIIRLLTQEESEVLLPLLRRKVSRVMSGVSVVAVMTKPYPCPHGRCAYCPGGPDEDSPQSYTGYEPAAMRGRQNQYDPYAQVRSRIGQLESIGHTVDKVDLIVMGGTFPASPRGYQEGFVKGCLDAITDKDSSSLSEAKLNAEASRISNVGITVETRPDCVRPADVDAMLELGVTRVELGVQNVYDDIYNLVNRGHTVSDVVDATRSLKDAALKVCYHMMPGLPGSSTERDLEGFRTIFEDKRFRPDMIKIYPTLVIEGTRLYDWWRTGKYEPLGTEEAAELVSKVKEMTPPWVRIMRVQRDIPLPYIDAGVDKSNLRQLALEKLAKRGARCRCIRCREVGHIGADGVEPRPKRVEIIAQTYEASEGIEVFVSAEDRTADALVGLLRMRIPSEGTTRPEIGVDTALVRELHVYGRMVPVGGRLPDAWQHMGWGESLMAKAERLAIEEYDRKKMVVMSALGTKAYYARLGYGKEGVYVSKRLN
ncbi:tRNA uridine(34) 5-carboxymethylaminomethyl modification radical SAM/GNAT enzyme Elp3 [Candidatus Bathyarchaeota archaeon]|nr:tRNA uridine(34) 5-carboxymethylaminomethyl modification radical SAM/GNAT enzyme Elp3 [Candidatus Bathyarchaeota archaeon]